MTAQERYEQELADFEARMQKSKPIRNNYSSDESYQIAYTDWQMAYHCDRPNKPGYTTANND